MGGTEPMAIVNNRLKKLSGPDYATRKDVLDAVRVCFANAKNSADHALAAKIKDLETDLLLRLGKGLDARTKDLDASVKKGVCDWFSEQANGLREANNSQAKALEAFYEAKTLDLHRAYEARTKALEEAHTHREQSLEAMHSKRMQELDTVYAKRLEDLSAQSKSLGEDYARKTLALQEGVNERITLLDQSYRDKEAFTQKAFEECMQRVSLLLERINIPQPTVQVNAPVTLPELAPQIVMPAQLPPNVTVEAPVVNLPALVAEVKVPEQQVTVSIPEQQPPTVNVNTPPRRKVIKTFTYHDDGRPAQVIEEETD